MNDYEKTIKDLQARVKSLELLIQPVVGIAEPKPKNWQPVSGDWWIDCLGNVSKGDTSFDIRHFGHERPTLQQAESAAIQMRKFNRLLALRDELCKDTVVEQGTANSRFIIFLDTEKNKWDFTYCLVAEHVTPYFLAPEPAQKACDMLNSGEVEL